MLNGIDNKMGCPICGSENLATWGKVPDMGLPERRHELSQCDECQHIFVNPLPGYEFLREAYIKGDPSVFSNNNFFKTRSKGALSEGEKWVWQHILRNPARGKFLDVGAVNVSLLRQVIAREWYVTLVEPGTHVEIMKESLGCNIYRGLFEECEFETTFDVISVIDVLEHVSSPVNFLKNIKKVLSPKGVAFLRMPNAYSLRCRIEGPRWNMVRPLGHLHYFTPCSFRSACAKASLRIRKLASHDLSHYLFFTFHGKRIHGLKLFKPFLKILNYPLLGDQLLARISYE